MFIRIGAVAVGGKGSRLGQSYQQKCLVPIEGKPILEYTIDAFVDCGVTLIFFLTGFLDEQISAYLTQRYGAKTKFVPATVFGGTTGIAPAIYTLRHFVKEDFIFAHGDSILGHNAIGDFVREAERRPDDLAIMLVSNHIEVAPTHVFVKTNADSGAVQTIRLATPQRRTSKNDQVDTGVYYFRSEVFDLLGRVKSGQQLASFIRLAKRAGYTVSTVVTKKLWFCLHTPDDLERWESLKATILSDS